MRGLGVCSAWSARRVAPAVALALTGSCLAVISVPRVASAGGAHAAAHFACSGPHAATTPCFFSTPSANVRCLWTPKPNNVACVRPASGRAYRLRPTGGARRITLSIARRGDTLPRNQQLVFPGSLSCHATWWTMTCNQNFGLGEFKLAPKGSHGR
jgi:hypothetical protein